MKAHKFLTNWPSLTGLNNPSAGSQAGRNPVHGKAREMATLNAGHVSHRNTEERLESRLPLPRRPVYDMGDP